MKNRVFEGRKVKIKKLMNVHPRNVTVDDMEKKECGCKNRHFTHLNSQS